MSEDIHTEAQMYIFSEGEHCSEFLTIMMSCALKKKNVFQPADHTNKMYN